MDPHYLARSLIACLIGVLLCSTLAAAQLELSRVRITTPGGSSHVKPGDTLHIDFRLANEGEEDLQDIDVTAVFLLRNQTLLRDEQDDIVNLTTTVRTLRKSTSVDRSLSFRVPYTVHDAEFYVLALRAEGRTANRSIVTVADTSDRFTIDRLSHELVYQLLGITPSVVACGGTATLSLAVRNIGNDNEEAVFTAAQPALSLQITESFTVQKDYDKNNTYSKQFPFSIPKNIEPRQYAIETDLQYGRGAFTLPQTLLLNVSCAGYVPPAAPTPAPQQPAQSAVSPPPTAPAAKPFPPPAAAPNASGTPLTLPPQPRQRAIFAGIAIITVLALALLIAVVLRLRKVRRILR